MIEAEPDNCRSFRRAKPAKLESAREKNGDRGCLFPARCLPNNHGTLLLSQERRRTGDSFKAIELQ